MTFEQPDSSEERIRQLQERLKMFTEFALAHQQWEADVLNDDGMWIDLMPDEFDERFKRVQELRNKAMENVDP